jgi:hypothetical protein
MQEAVSAVIVSFAAAVPATPAAAAELPADLAQAAAAFDAAQVASDAAALGRLLADDYVLVNSHGERESKAELIGDFTTPGFKLDPFIVEQRIVQLWPGSAVLGGLATFSGAEKGLRYTARLRFVDVWAKRAGAWQVIYSQASAAPRE